MTDTPSQITSKLAVRLLGDQYNIVGQDYWQFAPENVVQIGRSSKNEIQLACREISRHHATLSHDGSNWICTCVGRNGVFHDGGPVPEIAIENGMILQFSPSGPRLHFQHVGVTSDQFDANEDQSVVRWIEHLAHGEVGAASEMWDEYFERVVKLARSRISTRQRRVTDEEDVAVSVFESICAGIEAGKFPDLKSRDSLWRLLCVITKRKVARHVTHERRQKRGGGRVRGESIFVGAGADDAAAFGLDQIGAPNGADEFGLQLAEQTEWLFAVLGDDELCRIAELKLAEHTNEEIASSMGCHERTVKRRLQTIRSILASALTAEH